MVFTDSVQTYHGSGVSELEKLSDLEAIAKSPARPGRISTTSRPTIILPDALEEANQRNKKTSNCLF